MSSAVHPIEVDFPDITPYPNCVLVMPSLRQLRPGVTVTRFGRLVD